MKTHAAPSGSQSWAALILAVGALCCWAIYSQASGLTWQFDDRLNLKGLADASDWRGLVDFVFGGIAGPSGRPLSLLTFLADYGDWPRHPWGVVQRSLVLHLLNAGLVFLLLRALLARTVAWAPRAFPLAACIACLWLLMPIHASGILMPVQRMTLLSGFFVLTTLLTYTLLRIRLAGRAGFGSLALLAVPCATGMVLAVFSKENGVLVLAFIPLVEWGFLSRLPPVGPPRVWYWGLRLSFLAVPLYLFWYVASRWTYLHEGVFYRRGFTLSERLASEAVILWEYVRQMIVPRASGLGPFHDGHAVVSWSQPGPWLALAAWVALVILVMRWARTGSPLGRTAAFTLAFFLGAHLLESTVIPLELYFEHRNYLAALAVAIFAVLVAATGLANPRHRLSTLLLCVLLGGNSLFALQQLTSLWGRPLLAAELWSRTEPHSTRAAQYLAWIYSVAGADEQALRIQDAFVAGNPTAVDVRIQAMADACRLQSPEALRSRFGALAEALPSLSNPAGITAGLSDLGSAILEGKCGSITVNDYRRFLLTLIANDHVARVPRVRHHVEHQLAYVAGQLGQQNQQIDYLKSAFQDFPSYSGARVVAILLFKQGRNEEAVQWLDAAVAKAPNTLVGRSWQSSLASLRQAIEQVEAMRKAHGLEFIGGVNG